MKTGLCMLLWMTCVANDDEPARAREAPSSGGSRRQELIREECFGPAVLARYDENPGGIWRRVDGGMTNEALRS